MSGDARGRVLGGSWQVESILGEGATSTVYLARNLTSGVHGALKLFRHELSRHPRVLKLLLAEARLAAAIDHPGTVKVLGDGVDEDGSAFLVFELLVGEPLDSLRKARGGRVPLVEIWRIADAVMEALAAVHAAGVVHRDLKPANIFVLQSGGVKLVDFGFAKLQGHTAEAAQNVVGTPSFMPPEAALGLTKKVDHQSDIWSLGATLFYLLGGEPVHGDKPMDALMLASKNAKPRSLASVAPQLPSKVVDVVDRALMYRKLDRWPDIASMRAAWTGARPTGLSAHPRPRYESFLEPSLLVSEPSTTDSLPLLDAGDLESVTPQPPPVPSRKPPPVRKR